MKDHRNHCVLVVSIVLRIFDRTEEVVIHIDLLMTDEINVFIDFVLDHLRFRPLLAFLWLDSKIAFSANTFNLHIES